MTDLSRKCGGILLEGPGLITSVDADGDGMYDNELDCLWLIIADKDSLIELKFSHFNLAIDFGDYQNDYVSVSSVEQVYPQGKQEGRNCW